MSYSRDFTRLLRLLLTLFVVLLSHSRDINAGLTSTYVRPQWASTDMPLDNPAFAIPNGYNAPEQVHITQGDYEGKAIIVSWVTPAEIGSSEVFYGTTEHNYDHSAEGSVTQYTFYNYTSGFIHHCLIDGLEYNKKYYYKIGNGSSAREFWFFTPPKIDPDAAYKFGIIGDLGQTFHSLSTFEHYLKNPGQTVLYVGDLSYADDYEFDNGVRWDTWGRFVEPNTAYQPWIWTSGNHEIEFREDLYRYSNIAYNITNGDCSPTKDISAPIYITIGDGGNLEGLAGVFTEPQPAYSAFREASYGHAMLEIMNRTHAYYYWNRNDDGVFVASDSIWLHNRYWSSKLQMHPRNRPNEAHENINTDHQKMRSVSSKIYQGNQRFPGVLKDIL